jgi:hypothetical protein
MLSISLKHVRVVSAVALIALLLGWVAPLIGLIPFNEDVATARAWNTYDSMLPTWAVLVWAIVAFSAEIVGLIGMFSLWPPSRWILAGFIATTLAAQPLLGLAVFSAYEAAFAGISGTCVLWLVAISFWSPFASEFRKPTQPMTGQGDR